jgi:hypothetical protein
MNISQEEHRARIKAGLARKRDKGWKPKGEILKV